MRRQPFPLVLALLASLAAVAPVTAQAAKVGEPVPDFTFEGMVGHDGRTRLSWLVGHPVLIGGWRTHLVDGVHAARVASELIDRHGDKGLIVVMEDRYPWRGATAAAGRMAFWQTTAGKVPWLTCNPPEAKTDLPITRSTPRDTRSLVLIGVDGRLIVEGQAEEIRAPKKKTDFRLKFARLVAAEMKRRSKGWGDDKTAIKARAMAFGKGQLAKAAALLDGAKQQVVEHDTVRAEIARHIEGRLASIAFYLAEGRPGDAAAAVVALRKAVKGHDDWTARVDVAGAALATPEGKAALNLDRKLAALLAPVLSDRRSGLSPDLLGQLRVFAAAHPESQVGQRAARLDHFVASVLGSRLGMKHPDLIEKAEAYARKHGRG